MRHSISLAITLAVFWLLNSGHYSTLLLSLGALSIVLVLYLVHRMDVIDHESLPIHLTLKFPAYYIWLTREIVVANLFVVKHIWFSNPPISPSLKIIKANQKTDMGKVIYANSITLTPGTVTVNLTGDQFMVHALCRESIDELEGGEMDRRVCGLE